MIFRSDHHRVRYFRGRVTNFNQSEARKHSFLASDWLKFVTLPRKYRTLLIIQIIDHTDNFIIHDSINWRTVITMLK